MKKILITLFASVILISFVGCNLFTKDEGAQTLTGILSEQRYEDNYKGTHLLTDEEGKIYPVNSIVFNLSLPEYVGNKVRIQTEYDKENEIYRVIGISVLEILNGFKGAPELIKYENSKLGVSFQYQEDWQIFDNPDGIRLVIPEEKDFQDNSIITSSDSLSIDRYTGEPENFFTAFSFSPTDFDVKDSTTSGVPSQTYKRKSIDSTYIVVGRDYYVYVLSFNGLGVKFHDVLESFNFIEIEEVEDIDEDEEATEEDKNDTDEEIVVSEPSSPKTYDYTRFSEFQNPAYGFKVKYPDQWYYDGTYRDTDALSQYRFSDKPVDESNHFATLKFLNTKELPTGTITKFSNGNGLKIKSGDQIKIYVQIGQNIYFIEGPSEISDTLESIITSIEEL